MSSDFHSDKWTPLPTHLQVPLHDSYAPEGIHLRGEGRDFRLFDNDGSLASLPSPPSWMTEQELPCHGKPEQWFRVPKGKSAHRRAAELCAGCPVVETCLSFALEMEGNAAANHRYGIYGGKTPAQRYALSKSVDMLTNDSEETA